MKESILDILCCPDLKTALKLHVFKSEQLSDFNGKPYTDIDEGLLINENNVAYPILDGVPRLIEGALSLNNEFRKKWQRELQKLTIKIEEPSEEFKKLILPTLKRFETEWQEHDLEQRTWGLQQQERINCFLTYMNFKKEDVKGKLILDAGAGTGQLTCSYATLGCEVVGVDLSPAIVRGWKNRKKWAGNYSSNVTLIQADIIHLPFIPNTFDGISSLGVLHHTPNTAAAFNAITSFVKPRGTMGVWVYRKSETEYHYPLIPFVTAKWLSLNYQKLRTVTPKLPPKLLHGLLTIYASYFQLAYKLNGILRGKKHNQTIKERVTSLFDTFAPPYVWKHEPAEVINWFKAAGFYDVTENTLPMDAAIGINICGKKDIP
jgi:2-polyprenyl-3-methyl-5-hydroxy-6-metoxy-1,4-benzoquinol methylase